MAWGFEADCPDCGHHWEGIEASFRIGLWSNESKDEDSSLFCPRCCNRLYYPKSMERKAWQRWYERFLREFPFKSGWLLSLLAQINASFESAEWYQVRAFDPGEVLCPGCSVPMVCGASGGDRLICPRCGSNAPVRMGFTAHYETGLGEDGFS
jgi:hypothetical protein